MIQKAHITSSWLRKHIREREGILNITTRLVIVG